MRTSVMLTRCDCSVSSCTSPRWRSSLRMWRTCSPTRSRRTERPSGVSVRRMLQRPRALLDLEDFEIVAGLNVVGVREHHAAFKAGGDFGHVVLETSQRADRRRRDNDILARQARVETLANDAFEDEQAGSLVLLARGEDLLDASAADHRLDDLGAKLAGHCALHPVRQ